MDLINKLLWPVAISLILVNSIYYSILLKFPQFRFIRIMKSLKQTNKNSIISPTDTLTMALSSKIGVGSLAGIAIAVYYGGLGTIFWMWVSTFFLSIITYLENILAIIYREKDAKFTKSGPSYYIKKGLNNKKLSSTYALIIIITYAILFSSIQTNTITTLTVDIYDISKMIVTLLITISASLIILRNIKTISNICNKIFPLMMTIFITIGIIVSIKNLNALPHLFYTIFFDAFDSKALTGGIIQTIILALQKSIFANESGVGTSAIISGTTENNDYKLQGNIGIFQTYFINFVVLTTTAVIIGTSKYSNLDIINGIELTKYAFNYHLGVLGEYLLLLIIILFSFSTIITIYYYGENSLKSLTNNKTLIIILKIITITAIFIGGLIKAPIIWHLINITLALLTIINMYSIYKLKPKIIQKLTKK